MKQFSILGLDFGEKKIGLAHKPCGQLLPIAIGNFKNQGDVVGKVVHLAKEKEANLIIIGYPLRLNETKSPFTLKVEDFAQKLRKSLSSQITIQFVNEIFSTRETIERLRGLGKTPAFIEKNKDTYSAVLILERFLGIS